MPTISMHTLATASVFLQLIVKFKPGVATWHKSKALYKGSAAEKQVLRADGFTGDLAVVTVTLAPGQAKRPQLRDAASRIQMGA